MSAAAAAALHTGSAAPYPGLRPFEAAENDVFFGREAHTDQLLGRLEKTRFLAVVGTSGSGKSSLVRAGLLPALDGGYLTSAGSHWRSAIFRPGGDPIESLAAALRQSQHRAPDGLVADMTETTLRRSTLGLVDAVRQAGLEPRENLLLVVDQFEETFRYSSSGAAAESGGPAHFVALLLAASRSDLPIHILLTMRSDFLGECARFRGLAEAVNDGLYLIPRMTRDQLRLAIEAPAASFGGRLSPLLVEELLNGVEDNPDQLPLLQHALMRTWNHWKSRGDSEAVIGVEDYRAQGSVDKALSMHADEVYGSLPVGGQHLCQRVFQCLTDHGPDGKAVRRPARLSEIAESAGADTAAVAAVVDAYHDPEVAFLTRGASASDPVIDISHESLIRNWDRLRDWVKQDAAERDVLDRVLEAAALWRTGDGALWRDPNLSQALAWRDRVRPTSQWARCGKQELLDAMDFLESSRRDRDESREREKINRYGRRALVGLLALAAIMAFVYVREKKRATETLARRLAAESALELSQNSPIGPSTLMAVESVRRAHVLAADHVLRSAMARLPQDSSTVNLESEVRAAAWSPDSRLIAVGTAKGLSIYDWQRRQNQAIRVSSPVTALAFDPEGNFVASASEDGAILITPLRNEGSAVEFRLPDQVREIAFGAAGRLLAVACSDHKVYVVDRQSRKVRPLYTFHDTVSAVRFSPRGERLAAASFDGQVAMFDLNRETPLWTWHRESEAAKTGSIYLVNALAFYPDGKQVAVAAASSGVTVFDAATGNQTWRAPDPIGAFELEVDPAGKIVASAWGDSTVRLLDARTGVETARIRHQGPVYSLAFSPNGGLFASAGAGGAARLRSLSQNRELLRVPHSGDVNVAAFSSDGALLLTGSTDQTVRITPTKSLEDSGAAQKAPTEAGPGAVSASPDGRFLIRHRKLREDEDWEYIVVEAPDGKTLAEFKESVDGAFSPDGRYFAHGGEDQLTVARAGTWEPVHQIRIKGGIKSLSFSADGKRLAAGTSQGFAQVFDVSTGSETARIPHQQIADNAEVDYVAFDAKGHYLYTRLKNRFKDREPFRHALRRDDLIREACGRVGRSMTSEEWAERLPDLPYSETCAAR